MIIQASLIKQQEAKPPVCLNTAHARDMLHKRYAAPEWALLEEVAPKTGGGTRYADAVAVNLWSSRGHAVHGFEIKVSRSDWLRELKQPEKAEDVYQYCDYWWIVAPKGIVKDGELPPTWGLLELRESGLVQSVAAPKLSPKPITRGFFASLMRRGHEQVTSIAERMQRNAINAAHAEINERVKREVEYGTKHLRELEAKLAELKEKTGIDIQRYGGTSAETIKLAHKLESLSGWRGDGALSKLTELAADLESAAAKVRKAVEETGLNEGAA
jgi:hypothetical protein